MHTHDNQSKKFIHQTPSFSATALPFSTKISSLQEALWTRTSLLCLVEQSIRPSVRVQTRPLSLPSPWLSRLQIYIPQPHYHLHPKAIWKEFKIFWDEWNDRTRINRWAFSIPSKLFLKEFLDSVWSSMPWLYWVIVSSLRHYGFVRCLEARKKKKKSIFWKQFQTS